MYTTNAIESLNSSIRKYTKTKTVFPDDQAALKAVYLAVANVEKKWTFPVRDWGSVINQLIIKFGDRCGICLNLTATSLHKNIYRLGDGTHVAYSSHSDLGVGKLEGPLFNFKPSPYLFFFLKTWRLSG
jgi:hypothetical protein